ncbi:MAG TPA: PAS domain-containing sensor histidine kinase [Kofleriaceae bacterium]|nr:PAS domain-containing sensor histidine kinase [Kofleriaceae bacterium]
MRRPSSEDALARLERDRAVLGAIVQRSPIGVAFGNVDGAFEIVNDRLRTIIGKVTSPPVRFQDLAELVDFRWADGSKVTRHALADLLHQAATAPIEVEMESRKGPKPIWVSIRLAPVRAANQQLLGIVGVVRDVTVEHAIANLRKEIVAVIAHDLRSPIAAIKLSIESAAQDWVPGEAHVRVPAKTLTRVEHSAERLGLMVDELLDASHVELGTLPLERQIVDLCELIARLVDDLRPSLRGHPVATELPSHRVCASVDRLRIQQVLTNLLENAAKYARPDTTIHVSLREQDGLVDIAVADEGQGIDPDDVPKLFDRFYQAARARQRRQGLGLGLYITKGLVEAHGGSVSVESVVGQGSTFHVQLRSSACGIA